MWIMNNQRIRLLWQELESLNKFTTFCMATVKIYMIDKTLCAVVWSMCVINIVITLTDMSIILNCTIKPRSVRYDQTY